MELREGESGALISEAEALHIQPRNAARQFTDVFPELLTSGREGDSGVATAGNKAKL